MFGVSSIISFILLFTAWATATPLPSDHYSESSYNPGHGQKEINDLDILNYALTLEHLEAAYYNIGLKNFSQHDIAKAAKLKPNSDAAKRLYHNLETIRLDENTHVSYLEKAIAGVPGAKAVKPCTYSFPVTSAAEFLAVASILEGVGVSAYLGAAAKILSKTTLTVAGSILTIEARHATYLRDAALQNPIPFGSGGPFDIPLGLNQVFTLAAGFIVKCPPENPMLPLMAFPSLAVVSADKKYPTIKPGSYVRLLTPYSTDKKHQWWWKTEQPAYAAFITPFGIRHVKAKKIKNGEYKVKVPSKEVSGMSYVVLTKDETGVNDENTLAGPAVFEVSL